MLIVDAGGDSLDLLVARVRRLGYRAIQAKSPDGAFEALRDARFRIAAAIIPPDLPVMRLGDAIRSMRALAAGRELAILAAGAPPDPETRLALRKGGAQYAIFEPVDQHTLRFQLNRAIAGAGIVRGDRSSLRAPTEWPVRVVQGGRAKPARVYTVSPNGAFLATAAPSLRGARLRLTLPLPRAKLHVDAQVVMTNVPGNLERKNLPPGMGIRFEEPSVDLGAELELFVQRRFRQLAV